MTNTLKVISFDMDGTLVEPQFLDLVWDYGVPRLYAQKHGLSLEEAKVLVRQEYDKIGDGRIEWYDIKYWFQRFQLDQSWREMFHQLKGEVRVYPEVSPTLDKLGKTHPLIITSNATREFVEVEMEVSGLACCFSRIFSATSDFQLLKKTPDFYRLICRLLQVQPAEMVHVGDHWDYDFLVPRSLGITAFYLDRKGQKEGEFVLRDLTQLEERLNEGVD